MKTVYLIGSLRNPVVPQIGNQLREAGYDVFDDWIGAGPKADDHWYEYEKLRGRTYQEALRGRAAQNIFEFDRQNLLRSHAGILILPAGKSGHLELGFIAGQGKPGFILLDQEPPRYDVMYNFATGGVFMDVPSLIKGVKDVV